jgi:hypothetical protein
MNNQHDLLPWILGGLSVATVAVVITFASAGKTVAPGLSPVGSPSAQVTSVPDSRSLPAPAPVVTAAAAESAYSAVAPAAASVPDPETAPPPAAQVQPAADPGVQDGQIWECVTKGVKTFSNNPCGEKSTLLEVRAINTMNPTPVVRYARTYAPQNYSPAYADQDSYSDQDTYGEPGADTAVNSYTVVQGLAFLPRRRPDHLHHRQPFHNDPGHNPGANPGHNPGHNPGSPPRRN